MVSDLTTWPVSTEVNSVRHNGPELIEPLVRGAAELAGQAPGDRRGAADGGDDGTGALF